MKKILIIILTSLALFTFTGCGKEKKVEEPEPEKVLEVGKCRVKNNKNEVLVMTNDGTAINTTKYVFNNDTVESIIITQKYSNKDLAKTSYEALMKETQMTEQYASIELNEDTIVLKTKNEVVTMYAGKSKETIYNLMLETYKTYLEK